MRIIFMGTPDFAVASLDKLIQSGADIVGIITAPDRMGGRGMNQIIESPVKKFALKHHLLVLQPTNLKNEQFLAELKSLNADLQIVVAFRMLPQVIWEMPSKGTFNLHGSLLPKYRGAAPINWAIINGEKQTGVTTFFLNSQIDTGNILLQADQAIEIDDTAGSLHDKLMLLGANLVLETVKLIENNKINPIPQSGDSCPAPKIFHQTCKIEWHNNIEKVYDFIRGLSPYPGAWTIYNDLELKILQAEKIIDGNLKDPGTIEINGKKEFLVNCLNGKIRILRVKPEGKRIMEISDFINGLK